MILHLLFKIGKHVLHTYIVKFWRTSNFMYNLPTFLYTLWMDCNSTTALDMYNLQLTYKVWVCVYCNFFQNLLIKTMSNRAYFMSIQICTFKMNILYHLYIVTNQMKWQRTIISFSSIVGIGMWCPLIACIMWGIPWRASYFWARTLNRVGLGNCTHVSCKLTLTNLIKIELYFRLYFQPPHIPLLHKVHKVFPVPSICNDIATLISTEIIFLKCVFFLCKCRPNL